jgi:4'-phosphopantetheinyl transferase EntD
MVAFPSPIGPLSEHASRLGILVGFRYIRHEDDLNLLPDEAVCFTNAVAKVRRQSGAARAVARALCEQLGTQPCAIPKAASGAPVWPSRIVGSIAHDPSFAVAAVARRNGRLSIGIDIEPDEALQGELAAIVATSRERRIYPAHLVNSKLLFVVKEAVYKATFPLDGKALDFQDVEVDLESGIARTSQGISAEIIISQGNYIAALAITVP